VLEVAGFNVTVERTAATALAAIGGQEPDLLLLDLGLPDMDGKDVIDHTRRYSRLPIIVLSARGSEQEKVDALDRGANDYMAKPFGVHELLARVRAVLRSASATPRSEEFRRRGIGIDFRERRMTIGENQYRLSKREVELLRVLVNAHGQIVSNKQILSEIWGSESEADTQYVRVLVMQLRQKICADPSRPQYLIAEPGLGYRFALPDNDW
jgi:two-component system KDP operon response regulator KdpE